MKMMQPVKTIETQLQKYNQLNTQKKQIESELIEIKKEITDFIKTFGHQDSKGSTEIEYDGRLYRNEKRVTQSLSYDNLEEILHELGIYEMYTKTVIDELKVEEGLIAGLIPQKYLNEIIKRKETFAFTIRKKAIVDEEEEEFSY